MRPLEKWDEDYFLTEVVSADENTSLEKKDSRIFALNSKMSPTAETKNEIAKQVCAFSNSEEGFLVFGVTDAKSVGGSKLDEGIPRHIGNQPVETWIEQETRSLVFPPVLGCAAKAIQVAGHHRPDRTALVLAIPLSDNRPHWIPDGPGREAAYIRAGSDSLRMRLQTFKDISFRSGQASAEIQRVFLNHRSQTSEGTEFTIQPIVCLLTGSICNKWCVEVEILIGEGQASVRDLPHLSEFGRPRAWLGGAEPLFPGRPTGTNKYFTLIVKDHVETARFQVSLFLESAKPIRRTFTWREFEPR